MSATDGVIPVERTVEASSRLTAEQAGALAVAGASVALSAGAGCGKTTVLTERFVRALDGPTPVALGRVVALTFTNKAARELRDRIRRECRRKVAAGVNPEYWRGVVRGLEAARIGTFHSFCGEFLRRHAIEAGIDPGFEVLDESVSATLRDESLATALRSALARRDRDLIELAVDFGLGAVRAALKSLLSNRSGGDVAAWGAKEPRDLVTHWLDRFHAEVRPDLLARFRAECQKPIDLMTGFPGANPKVLARLAEFADAVAGLDAVGPGDPVPAVASVQAGARVVGLLGKFWPTPEVYEAIKAHFETIRKLAEKTKDALAWDEATTTAAATHGIRFARLAALAHATYDRLKRLRGGVDHDDLLLLTRALVTGASLTIQDALVESADLILVDEFQDTDPVQGEILARMAGSNAAMVDGRLFLVGDFKQSIYRFRGADPALFERFRNMVPPAGRRNLTANFRSVPGILEFVNALFDGTFREEGAALRPGGGASDSGGPPAVLFSWGTPVLAPPGGTGPGGKPDAVARRGDEAHRLARYLADRLGADAWMIRDPRTGQLRPAHPGDVAILFRTLTESGTYEQALVAEGLDFHVVGGSGFFAQQEVLDLINVLSSVEDPTDSVALAGALRSPFFSISDDALFWIAVEASGVFHRGLKALAGEKAERLPEADRARVARAHRLLSSWGRIKDAVPIAALVDRVLDESGYEAALLGERLGDRKRANARKLVRMARRLDAAGGFTLAHFVERLRNDLKAATKETQAATTDDAGRIVRLMSIHQAKGLEFPIVVVPDLDRKRPDELRRVAFDSNLGPLVNPVAPADDGSDNADADAGGCLGWSVYRHLERKADDAEALRLLYVATTRARDFLILSAATDPTRPTTSPAMTLLDQRFDRASGRFRAELPAGWAVPRIEVLSPEPGPTSGPQALSRPRTEGLTETSLLEVAGAIREALARPVFAPVPRTSPALPGWVPLDPAAGLAATARNVDRLCRAILQDYRSFDAGAIAEIARRVARGLDHAAGPGLISRAVERYQGWFARLPADLRCHEAECARRWDWTVAWPSAGPTTVFAGWGDFRLRHPDGSVAVVLVGAGTITPGERLRAIFSARSLDRPGASPVDQVWWLSWDAEVPPTRFDRTDNVAACLVVDLWAEDLARERAGG